MTRSQEKGWSWRFGFGNHKDVGAPIVTGRMRKEDQGYEGMEHLGVTVKWISCGGD